MKTKQLLIATALLALSSALVIAAPLGTAFTYQGRLADGGAPANGSYDLTFTLYDDASTNTTAAGPLTNSPVSVTNGQFTTTLDFGADVFTGSARWLEIGVRSNGVAADFTPLSPRQPLTPSPYALYAPSAGTATTAGTASSVAAANVTGTLGTAQIPDLDAAKITSGTLADARLSPNVALRSGGNTFSSEQSFQGNIRLNYNKLFLSDGSDPNHALGFYGFSLPFGGWVVDGPVLSGFSGGALGNKQGPDEEIVLCWQGPYVGIGTTNPTNRLQVVGTVQGTAFIGDGSGLTALNAANVTGTLADARLSPNVALLNNSQTFSGAKTFSANVTATRSLRLQGLLRSGSETNAASASYPLNPDGSTGLVIRRITSTTTSSNSVVARTDQLTLVRDGTASGLNIVFAPGAWISTINATGITREGTVVTRVLSTFSPPAWTVVFSDSQKVVHYDISFGDTYDSSHTCHVVLDRFDDGVESDYFMVGTLTSTYNQ